MPGTKHVPVLRLRTKWQLSLSQFPEYSHARLPDQRCQVRTTKS